jgi:hypothetical protein
MSIERQEYLRKLTAKLKHSQALTAQSRRKKALARKLLDRNEDVDAQTADMIEQYRNRQRLNRQRLNGCQGANRVAYVTSAIDVMMKKG